MLLELHVKNLALIEKADLEFDKGLTVLSGETGAGKSILIDSINYALGAKAGKSVIRNGEENASIELVFDGVGDACSNEEISDDVLIVSRKITPTKSIVRLNDETVTQTHLREVTKGLIDMHGQFEHQSLMQSSNHLTFIDKLSGEENSLLRAKIKDKYKEYNETEKELSNGTDKALREREADILRYEIEEIEKAQLKTGEEEELLDEFRKMKNSSKITSALAMAKDSLESNSDSIARASKAVNDATAYDDSLNEIRRQLSEIDELITEAGREISDYTDSMSFDEERFDEIESRLDVIHRMQGKYGDDVEIINASLTEKKERLSFLDDYDSNREALIKKKNALKEELNDLCSRLGVIRKETADRLKVQITKELEELNFLGVDFDINLSKLEKFTESGTDKAEFMISTNPGQPRRPLSEVASGGELSRIMLALKSVMADADDTETLIFDEIDTGISGITAQKVAEKLKKIGAKHQVLCITHLPQIAAAADHNIVISKSTDGISTRTDIRYIVGDEIKKEIERMVGGADIIEKFF